MQTLMQFLSVRKSSNLATSSYVCVQHPQQMLSTCNNIANFSLMFTERTSEIK